jgi:DoxX-like family
MNPAQLAFRITTTLTVVVFAGSGFGNLIHHEHIVVDMAAMGYPSFFMTLLGFWKVVGAVTVAVPGVPRLKEWAYAGMFFDLSGAALSRAVSGFGLMHFIIPLVLCAVLVTSWALRPPSRRLASAGEAPRGLRFVA